MQLETRGPGASSQATGALVGNAYKENVTNAASRVNKPAQSISAETMFDSHCDHKTRLYQAVVDITTKGKPAFAVNIQKKPLTANGFKDATTDKDSLRAMFSLPGVAGIGIPTGKISGLLVIDRDRKGGLDGVAACKELEMELGELPETLQQITGSGGDQLFFQYPDGVDIPCSASKVCPGVDIRNDGGYVVVPPSVNESGPYVWANRLQPAPLPQAWIDHLARKPRAEYFMPCPPIVATLSTAYGATALEKECRELAAMGPNTGRNVRLNEAAFACGQLVAGGELVESEALIALEQAAAACGLDEIEAGKTIQSGFGAGMNSPRQARERQTTMPPIVEAVSGGDWPEPMELNALNEQDPYPLEDLPPTVRDAVDEVVRNIMCPVSLAASCALGAMSLAIQGQYDVQRAPGLRGPSSLFLLTSASSGERKSECERLLMAELRAYEDAQKIELDPEVKSYRANHAAWEATKEALLDNIKKAARKNEDKSSYEKQLENHVKSEPTAPLVPSLFFEEPSTQQLIYALGKKWPSAGIFSDEAGVVFGGHAMQSINAMQTFATWNKLWSGDSLSNERRGESYGAKNCRLSMHLMTQEATLREFISSSRNLVRGTGLMARYLLSSPVSTMGTRFVDPLTFGRQRQMPHLAKFTRRVLDIVKRPLNMIPEGGINPQVIQLSANALDIWCGFYNHVEGELRSDGEFADVKDIASKVAENAARLACLFYVMSDPQGGSLLIDESSMQSGLIVAAWHLAETKRFLSVSDMPHDRSLAMALDTWIVQHCVENHVCEVPRSTVLQYGPNCIRSKTLLDKAIVELSELGRIRESSNGKRKSLEVNPAIIGGKA